MKALGQPLEWALIDQMGGLAERACPAFPYRLYLANQTLEGQ